MSYGVLNVKVQVGIFNHEKALVGAFSVIVKNLRIFVWSYRAALSRGSVVKWGSPWRLSSSLHKSIKLLLRADNVPTRPCYTCHDFPSHSRHTSRITPRPHHHIIVNCWKIRGSPPGRLQSPPPVPKLQQEVDNISENIHCWAAGWLLLLLMIRHYLNIWFCDTKSFFTWPRSLTFLFLHS